jgi:hypothetical protein
MKLTLLLIALTACTEIDSVDRGVCGNGLLEAGEDCDSGDPQCVSCALTCSTVDDCPTADYACGVDGVCHAPGGVLGQARSVGTFSAEDVRVTDIDEDGIGDALGLTSTSMVIRHGDAAAQFDRVTSLITPTQTGPFAFGDIDGDGAQDVAISTPDGIVGYSSPYGELAPIPVNESLLGDQGDAVDIKRLVNLGANMFTAFVVDPDSDAVALLIQDEGGTYPVAPCYDRTLETIASAAFDAGSVDVYVLKPPVDKPRQIDAVISIQTGTGAARAMCMLSVHRDNPPLIGAFPTTTIADVTPDSLPAPVKPVVLADLDADTVDGCPGVVSTDGGLNALKYLDGALSGGHCAFALTAPSSLNPLNAPAGTELVGRAPVDPPIGFVARDALVTTEGVYPFLLTYPVPVYHTTRKISYLGHGDINGDDAIDVVIGAQGEGDLDVLYRVADQPGFNLYRLDTASTVTSMITGDYDGNGIDDVAYIEDLGDHSRLAVDYGTRDLPTAPVSIAQFAGVTRMDIVAFPDSVDVLGIADDLIVFQPPAPGGDAQRITLLHGNPQRTMLSYFDPRPEDQKTTTLFRGAVIGNFTDAGASAGHPDLMAFATTKNDMTVRAWKIPGTPDGLDGTESPGTDVSGVGDCSLPTSTSLCLNATRYLAFTTGDHHDVLIGIDRAGHASGLDPWADVVTAHAVDVLQAAIPASTVPRSLYQADLDGDGASELVAALAPTSATTTGAILACTMSGATPQSCDDLVPEIRDAATADGVTIDQCYDATPVRLSYRDPTVPADARVDLAVACRGDGGT